MSEDTDSQCKKEELEKIPKYKILNEGRYYILTVTGVLMIASILLITTTSHIYNAKKCDLKKALDSLDLKYTSQPCKYYGMKEISHEIFKLGKGVLSWNFIAFIGILFLHFGPSLKYKHVCVNISCGVITFIALLIFILCLLKYNKVAKTREETTEINYSQIESAMLTGLEKYYTSDDMNNSDYRSLSWNTFFIQYDCCGVREFQESTNDFKNTPWCKSSGTCQTDATYQIWLRLAKVVLEKKMLTHDERRTTHDDGRQPIVIGHLAEKRTRPKTLDEAVMAAMQEECIRSQKQRKATLEGTSNKCMQ
ncbi:uncharacterized protein LOC111123564 isoform X2 [Crassostrea virginica]